MRLVISTVLSLSLAAVAFGQRGGGHGGGVSRGGFSGGAVHSGGVSRGGFSGGFARSGVSAGFNRGGGIVRGGGFNRAPFLGNRTFRTGFGRGFRFRSPFFRFYGYPFYGGSYYYNDPYYYDDSYYGSQYPYSYTSGYYPPEPYADSYEPAPEPPVVYGPQPTVTVAPTVARTNRTPEYLLAFNDHNIKLAVAYWTEKTNLRYVTTDHEIKTVPLASVDRDLSMRLNYERRVTFNLPAGP